MEGSDPNFYYQDDAEVIGINQIPQETPQRRPKTGKSRSIHYEYAEKEVGSSKKKRKRSRSASAKKRRLRPKKRKTKHRKTYSAKPINEEVKGLEAKNQYEEEKFPKFSIPIANATSPDEIVAELRSKLIDVIISQRLVKEEDLDLLFNETLKSNIVGKEEYQDMVREIKEHIGISR